MAKGVKPQGLRSNPATLYRKGIHSNLLTEHPMTQRAQRQDLEKRQRELAEMARLGDEKAGEQARGLQKDLDESKEGKRRNDYAEFLGAGLVGYLIGHQVAYLYLTPGEDSERLPYDAAEGFVDAIIEQQQRLADLSTATLDAIDGDLKAAKLTLVGRGSASSSGGGFFAGLFGRRSSVQQRPPADAEWHRPSLLLADTAAPPAPAVAA